ncbi:hypothetical protein CWI38_0030p0010 [Hamiltosporidium tvaerminnensis]|uniref:Uncharacterized protein n=1 Tax=Hamiltosporidium tvaerminnensis TaxID=1176355 RepID=A0A4Q9M3E0_9MICR|nr:hypothetical protein CWI38_0030p0010 [Hamiltosporidium tvaerminnensis]
MSTTKYIVESTEGFLLTDPKKIPTSGENILERIYILTLNTYEKERYQEEYTASYFKMTTVGKSLISTPEGKRKRELPRKRLLDEA